VASREIRWHPEALEEAREARDWYASRSLSAARGFLTALENAVKAVVEDPLRWPARAQGCRQFVFPNQYPFTLVFSYQESLRVIAVAHQSRRPGYWKGR